MARMTQTVRDEATAIHDQRDRAVNAAMNDPNLSSQGVRVRAARAQLAAQQAMDGLRATFEGGAALTGADLARRLFGSDSVSGADAVSVRDAADRASQLNDPDDAMRLLQTAQMTGDAVLAKAVARQAFAQASGPMALFGGGWAEVLDNYAMATPGFAEQLQAYRNSISNSLQDSLDSMVFLLPMPSIISDLSPEPEDLQEFIDRAGAAL